jgi:hypothetical protein
MKHAIPLSICDSVLGTQLAAAAEADIPEFNITAGSQRCFMTVETSQQEAPGPKPRG